MNTSLVGKARCCTTRNSPDLEPPGALVCLDQGYNQVEKKQSHLGHWDGQSETPAVVALDGNRPYPSAKPAASGGSYTDESCQAQSSLRSITSALAMLSLVRLRLLV